LCRFFIYVDFHDFFEGAVIERDIYEIYEENSTPPVTLPLYTVLTLSATASEFNSNTVISDPSKKEKLGGVLYKPVAR
jgi:alcohol dehydrogenase YqhD (iron-dependent ADH family)